MRRQQNAKSRVGENDWDQHSLHSVMCLMNCNVLVQYAKAQCILFLFLYAVSSQNARNTPGPGVEEKNAARIEKDHVLQVYDQIASHFSVTRHKPWPQVLEVRYLCYKKHEQICCSLWDQCLYWLYQLLLFSDVDNLIDIKYPDILRRW